MQRRSTWRSSIFEKSFFYARKRSSTKFACNFLAFFGGFSLVRNFLAYKWTFKKIEERHALHLWMLYRMVKKKFRKNIVEGKKSRMENWSFLAIVRLITFLNKHILGWNFYRRLSALGLTYPENFSPFGCSWAKIDFRVGGGGGLKRPKHLMVGCMDGWWEPMRCHHGDHSDQWDIEVQKIRYL